MKISEIQRKKLYDQIKMEALTGKIGNRPFIPTDDFIAKEINRRHGSSSTPSSDNEVIEAKSVSNPDRFSEMLKDIVEDLKTLKIDVKEKREFLENYFETSKLEYEAARTNIDELITESNALHAGMPNEELSYTLFDGFKNSKKIDKQKTDLRLDVENGYVTLGEQIENSVSLAHHRVVTDPGIVISQGLPAIQYRRHLRGSEFRNLFNNNELDNWIYEVRVTNPDEPIEIYFDLRLHPQGHSIKVNEINIAAMAAAYKDAELKKVTIEERENKLGSVSVEVMGPGTDGKWRSFPDKKPVKPLEKKMTWRCASKSELEISDIRIKMKKNIPDAENVYRFSLSEISVLRSDFSIVGELVTKPLEVIPYNNEKPVAVSAALSVDQDVPEGTEIKYYVGLDEPVSGYFADANSNKLDFGSPNITQFIPTGVTDDDYVFASQLRELNSLLPSGSTDYSRWEPQWEEIAPAESEIDDVPKYIEFDNFILHSPDDTRREGPIDPAIWGDETPLVFWASGSYGTPAISGTILPDWEGYASAWGGVALWGGFEKAGYFRPEAGVWPSGWYETGEVTSRELTASGLIHIADDAAEPDFEVFGKDFYKMFLVPSTMDVVPGSFKLSMRDSSAVQGEEIEHMWQFLTEDSFVWKTHTAYSDSDTDVMDLLPSGSLDAKTIRITASGIIEHGSIADFKHKGSNIPYQENFDYYVTYNGDSLDIDISPISYNEVQRGTLLRAWQATYRFKQSLPEQNSWVTFLYNKTESTIDLNLNETFKEEKQGGDIVALLEGFKVDYLDSASTTGRLPASITSLRLEPGWNKIYVYSADTSSENLIHNIFDKASEEWNVLTSYISPGMQEMNFTELTRLTSPDVYTLFSVTEDSDGLKYVVVPSLNRSELSNPEYDFTNKNAEYYVFRNDAHFLPNVYAVEFKQVKDKRKNRVLMRVKMKSDEQGITPTLRGYMIFINDKALEVAQPPDELNEKSIGTTYEV